MSAEPNVTDPAEDEINIRNVLKGFAWNRHDAEAFSRAFAEDADFTNVRGISAHGRTARFIMSDVAAVDGWWEMTGARDRNGQEIPLRKGLLNLVMTKQDAQ